MPAMAGPPARPRPPATTSFIPGGDGLDPSAPPAPTRSAGPVAAASGAMGVAPEDRELFAELERISGFMPEAATEAVSLRDPQEAWDERLRMIRDARESVVMSSYFLHPDAYSVQLVDALVAAAQRGVRVVLCLDDFAEAMAGPTYPAEFRAQIASGLRALEAAGGFVSWYAHPDQHLHFNWGNGNHFKAMVVDSRDAIFGGRNIGGQYIEEGRWTDCEFRLRGPVVARLTMQILEVASHGDVVLRRRPGDATDAVSRDFSDTLRSLRQTASRRATLERALVREETERTGVRPAWLQMVYADPTFGEVERHSGRPPADNPVTLAMIAALDHATTSIMVSSNYLNGDEALIQAFERAAQRGVRVDIITTGSVPSTGMAAVIHAGSVGFFYDRLFKAGVHIHETERQEHGKMLLIDDRIAGWGSYNLELCSDVALVEAYMFTADPAIVRQIGDNLRDTMGDRTVEWRPRQLGFWDEVAQFFMKIFAWIIRPFL